MTLHSNSTMQNIDWNSYRHPKFLQSLNISLNERKYLGLFLKKSKFDNIGNLEDMGKTRLVTDSKVFNSAKIFVQEKISIDI
jgi:hypothetical protein